MPSGPGVIPEELIAEIAASVPPSISTFLLTSKQDAPSIIDQQKRCRVNTVQICDSLEADAYADLRREMPGVSLVQVIHVAGEESVDEAMAVAPYIDAILLDSGNQKLSVKELGGTGRVHDWDVSRRIREEVEVPVFLAGGLKAENIVEAIEQVRPFGVDICSGVRKDGRLDRSRLAFFFAEIEGVKRTW
jgi:phosphoribosylanthranilate isomerase